MSLSKRKAPHEYTKLVESLKPIAGTGSAQNGSAVDRRSYLSAIGVLAWATSGGVTAGTVTAKFQDSTDGSTGWADFGSTVTVNIPAGPNASGVSEVPVDLSGAKAFVRMVVDADPTGGTPASIVSASVLLCGPDQLPAA